MVYGLILRETMNLPNERAIVTEICCFRAIVTENAENERPRVQNHVFCNSERWEACLPLELQTTNLNNLRRFWSVICIRYQEDSDAFHNGFQCNSQAVPYVRYFWIIIIDVFHCYRDKGSSEQNRITGIVRFQSDFVYLLFLEIKRMF